MIIYKGKYVVSEFGEVWNIKTKKKIKPHVHEGRKGSFYLRYTLDGKHIKAHRLVYICFNGPIPKDMQLDHYDGNSFNNYKKNIIAVTPEQNRMKKRSYRHYMQITMDK